ncbi:MAG: helix-turn-helix transcriptional regulator [Prevotella sp.]|jgi:hypothetical protein
MKKDWNSEELKQQEKDYEAKLLAHGLLDSINKSNGHISVTLSSKGVETLCRIGAAMMPEKQEQQAKQDDSKRLITKEEAKEMLGVCDTTLWAWGKRHYLEPIKVGSRIKYRLADVKHIMEG